MTTFEPEVCLSIERLLRRTACTLCIPIAIGTIVHDVILITYCKQFLQR